MEGRKKEKNVHAVPIPHDRFYHLKNLYFVTVFFWLSTTDKQATTTLLYSFCIALAFCVCVSLSLCVCGWFHFHRWCVCVYMGAWSALCVGMLVDMA